MYIYKVGSCCIAVVTISRASKKVVLLSIGLKQQCSVETPRFLRNILHLIYCNSEIYLTGM